MITRLRAPPDSSPDGIPPGWGQSDTAPLPPRKNGPGTRTCDGDFPSLARTYPNMPRNPRLAIAGYPHHVTQRGTNGQPVFRTDADRKLYLELALHHKREAGVRIEAYCLMTNHVHFVAVPDGDDSLSVWLRRLHGRYSQYFNARTRRSGHLWQGRFYSCVLSPGHLQIALRYVEQNPVRAHMVAEAADYRWSSSRAHLSGKRGALLDGDEWVRRGGVEGWKQLLAEPPRQPLVHMLRRCTYGGRPFGDEAFLQSVELASGQTWRRWPYMKALQDSDVALSLDKLGPEGAFSVANA